MSRRGMTVVAWLIGIGAMACEDVVEPLARAVFEVQVVDEKFRVEVTDPAQIDSFLARLESGVEANITGALRSGPGDVNAPWSWHLDPETVEVAQLTMEVCDGRPSMVEEGLEYWLGTVERYCPWGVRVVARVM